MQHKLNFSGHESFHCRSLWLKKGYEFISSDHKFSEPSAVVDLGVGKNMVSSISYWMNSFGLAAKENRFSELADFIMGEEGVDPYLEDNASLWLLHYHLVVENLASIYSIFFNEFRKHQIEFNKTQLTNFLKWKCEETNTTFNDNTIKRDIAVFLRTYIKPIKSTKNLEDIYTGLFIDLNIIEIIKKFDTDEIDWYRILNKDRDELPIEVILYSILNNENYTQSISFEELLIGYNSPGNIFAISPNGLLEKIAEMTNKYKDITFSDDAGIRELQFKNRMDKWDILKRYYEK
ncbi:MAG: DUF4007 family protein [Ignavibacteria bacterium]|nr:DUF4007 family protein [Ignavibacteria bacterium]